MTSMISIANSEIVFPCDSGERILDAAERAGYSLPYSCRKGVCESCRGKLTKGTVAVMPSGTRLGAGSEVYYCMAAPDGMIEIAPKWIVKRAATTRSRLAVSVKKIEYSSADVAILQLRLPIGRRIRFSAGQYVSVFITESDSRNYSLANPPQVNDAMELHVRRVPGGRFSDLVLQKLDRGSLLDVEFPFGQFGWSGDYERPALLLGTGTGFAPLKSMIKDLIHRGVKKPVHFFWGGWREADLYEMAQVKRWSETLSWFKFTPVLAGADSAWAGATGHIQHMALVMYPDLSNHEVYACGNPAMIADARQSLIGQGALPEEDFRADAFVSTILTQPAVEAPLACTEP